jgi:4-hydroxybenzoate polyprenyltransferase
MKKYLKLMRIHHYIKNFLVFAALACSGQFFQTKKLLAGTAGFVAFCLVSSVVYIVNDIRDKEKDRCHPTKCNRPIASGEISEKQAWILVAVLLIVAFFCNMAVFRLDATLLLLLYVLLNLAYSMGLKNVPLLDVTILVSGFLIRVLYGACVTDIAISNWALFNGYHHSLLFCPWQTQKRIKANRRRRNEKGLKIISDQFFGKEHEYVFDLGKCFLCLMEHG